jgi:ABC-2 type transport system permease protein
MKNESIKRILSVAQKEKFHILRDPYALAIAIAVPLFIVLVFGFVIDFDVKDIPITFQDQSQSVQSRDFLQKIENSGYFKITKKLYKTEDAFKEIENGKSKAFIQIPPDFGRDIISKRPSQVQILLDGADNSTAGVILGYLSKFSAFVNFNYFGVKQHFQVNEQFYYNPQLLSSWFVVPGLTAIILALISILLTALTVAKEWENGSMELLLSTPVKPIEIILGKMIPYLFIGIMALILVLIVSFIVFKIPFNGSFITFTVTSIVFLVSCLAQGILISILAKNQQLAMQISMITGLLPSLLLSGFIFPIENMPTFFQILTSILPARWYILISRSIFLKGADISNIILPSLALLILSSVLVLLALKNFKPNLENS